jgi:hypothetical protein
MDRDREITVLDKLTDVSYLLTDLAPVLVALLTLDKINFIRALRTLVGEACNGDNPGLKDTKKVADKVWEQLNVRELRDGRYNLLQNYKESHREKQEVHNQLTEALDDLHRERYAHQGTQCKLNKALRKADGAVADEGELIRENQRLDTELVASEAKVEILMQVISEMTRVVDDK